ncbi:hypothetical protein APSETT444_003329 [Aspergillus pseudonomiae]
MDAAALFCNICPKKPKFSDVSHLLTHVSSKAHLSHYFKLQVRSHQESQAVILLDEYDRWYKANNLAKLLSDRLASKDARRKRIHGTAAPHDKTCPAKEDHGHKSPTGPVRSPHGNALPDYLDPRLVTSGVYMEHDDSDRGTYVSADCVTGVASPNRDVQANAESSHLLHPTPGSQISTEAAACQWKQERVFGSDDEGGFDLECTPSWSKTLGHTAQMASQLLNRQLLSYDPLVDDIESEVDKDRVDEIARLKGVLWPGMDIFDSATAQMRRKRNQKKDENALRMMEKTSMGVEPTELIFSPTGILRKQRVISGNVEDSSPLKGETPIPRRRSTRSKRALSQTDANIQRGQDRKRKKKVVKHVPITVGQDLNHRDSYFTRATSPEAPSGGNQLTHGESADDFALTFNGPESRSRTGLKIFCDTPNQNISDQHCGDGLHFGLVASSDALFLQQEAITTRTPSSVLSSNYISEFAERLCRFTTDKENIDPLSDAHGRIDPLVGWHSPVIKRHLASNTGYPSQFLFGDSQRIELNMFDGHDSHVGYSYNPLAASFPKLSAEENPIYTMDTSNGLSFQDATYVTSPEATISDIEDDDFERLYLDGSSC